MAPTEGNSKKRRCSSSAKNSMAPSASGTATKAAVQPCHSFLAYASTRRFGLLDSKRSTPHYVVSGEGTEVGCSIIRALSEPTTQRVSESSSPKPHALARHPWRNGGEDFRARPTGELYFREFATGEVRRIHLPRGAYPLPTPSAPLGRHCLTQCGNAAQDVLCFGTCIGVTVQPKTLREGQLVVNRQIWANSLGRS